MTSNGADDVFLAKLDLDGDFVWARGLGSVTSDSGYALAVDAGGNVIFTGQFSGTVDFDPGAGTADLTSNGGLDAFVARFDTNGDLVWARSLGGSGVDAGYGVAFDGGGNAISPAPSRARSTSIPARGRSS